MCKHIRLLKLYIKVHRSLLNEVDVAEAEVDVTEAEVDVAEAEIDAKLLVQSRCIDHNLYTLGAMVAGWYLFNRRGWVMGRGRVYAWHTWVTPAATQARRRGTA